MDQAMRTYTALFAGSRPSRRRRLTPALLRDTLAARSRIRAEEGGGGMCHLVTEWLEDRCGWERLGVSYLSPRGEVICSGHYVSLLPDGSIFDPTSDQMGEGRDFALIGPDEAGYGRYRPEFDGDFNPAIAPEASRWASLWTGEADHEAQDRLRRERGYGWWTADKSAMISYWEAQIALMVSEGANQWSCDVEDARRRIQEISRPRRDPA